MRNPSRLAIALIFAAFTVTLGAIPAAADSGCTASASLSSLASVLPDSASGGCVQIGTTQFTDWSFKTSGNAALFDPTAISVTASTLSGNPGVLITGGFTTTTNMDVNIQFEVEAAGPEGTSGNFNDAHLALLAGGANNGGQATITETVRSGSPSETPTCTVLPCVP